MNYISITMSFSKQYLVYRWIDYDPVSLKPSGGHVGYLLHGNSSDKSCSAPFKVSLSTASADMLSVTISTIPPRPASPYPSSPKQKALAKIMIHNLNFEFRFPHRWWVETWIYQAERFANLPETSKSPPLSTTDPTQISWNLARPWDGQNAQCVIFATAIIMFFC